MIANLMMYQRPQLVEAHDRFWQLIRRNLAISGMQSPATLSQDAEEFFVWNHPELVLSQTCGMPYRTWLHDKVTLVGTPDYGVPGCQPGYYCSMILVRKDDPRNAIEAFRDATFAYNQTFSQSGFAAPYWHTKSKGFWFENRLQTEQHLESARAVAQGHADIASLDAVSWRLISAYEPFANQLRVLEATIPTPGLPLITSRGHSKDVIFDAVSQAISALTPDDKAGLGIKAIIPIPKAAYLAIANPPQTAS